MTKMFKIKTAMTIFAAPLLLGISNQAGATENLDLEPCINGAVSANGLYPTQAMEDAALMAAQKDTALEPHINGEVSPTGRYASQTQESAVRA